MWQFSAIGSWLSLLPTVCLSSGKFSITFEAYYCIYSLLQLTVGKRTLRLAEPNPMTGFQSRSAAFVPNVPGLPVFQFFPKEIPTDQC